MWRYGRAVVFISHRLLSSTRVTCRCAPAWSPLPRCFGANVRSARPLNVAARPTTSWLSPASSFSARLISVVATPDEDACSDGEHSSASTPAVLSRLTNPLDRLQRNHALDSLVWEFINDKALRQQYERRNGPVRDMAFYEITMPFVRKAPMLFTEEEKSWLCFEASAEERRSKLEDALFSFLDEEGDHRSVDAQLGDDRAPYLDLRAPERWFPLSSGMRRKVILHVGPTNSGKTHAALESLKKASSGVYCGPLRLLAHEVYERMNDTGVPTSLLTGQVCREVKDAKHVACTIEMADVTREVDVAVVDEIQMLADRQRGWAWTRAVLGLPGKELHLCGNETANGLVARMLRDMDVEFEEHNYSRLSPLICENTTLDDVRHLDRGDCVIAFSKKDIFRLKSFIESNTEHRCCVVYGSLPPETRTEQAALFNAEDNDYTVLVASDAIGMGLNLNIRRVIFSSLRKFDGVRERGLTDSEIKQIAGRAGRYGGVYPDGFVTCFVGESLSRIISAIDSKLRPLQRAGIQPMFEHVDMYARSGDEHFPKLFSQHLGEFCYHARVGEDYFLSDMDDIFEIAALIDRLPLASRDRHTFCAAPVDVKNNFVLYYFVQYAREFVRARSHGRGLFDGSDGSSSIAKRRGWKVSRGVSLNVDDMLKRLSKLKRFSREDLGELESVHKVLDLYLWLSLRFEGFFPDGKLAMRCQQMCNSMFTKALETVLPAFQLRGKRKSTAKESSPRKKTRRKRRRY